MCHRPPNTRSFDATRQVTVYSVRCTLATVLRFTMERKEAEKFGEAGFDGDGDPAPTLALPPSPLHCVNRQSKLSQRRKKAAFSMARSQNCPKQNRDKTTSQYPQCPTHSPLPNLNEAQGGFFILVSQNGGLFFNRAAKFHTKHRVFFCLGHSSGLRHLR